jgi:hypothetical protein
LSANNVVQLPAKAVGSAVEALQSESAL